MIRKLYEILKASESAKVIAYIITFASLAAGFVFLWIISGE